jgi:SAM-dependent methyltransferase
MPNTTQAAHWDGPGGGHRIRYAELFEAELRLLDARFRAATGITPGENVLDIGCGTGGSTRAAALAARPGIVLGVDLSEPMLALARRLSAEQGLTNITFERADAQSHAFPPAAFDACISRFGVMFFDDPVAAFTNIARALRPGGRLVAIVWQDARHNEWYAAVREAIGRDPVTTPAPFTFGDPDVVERILGAAGFVRVRAEDVREPVYYGPDVDTAYGFTLGLGTTQDLLTGLDATATETALDHLRATLRAHDRADGVYFDSRAWIVTAQVPAE